MVIPVSPGLCLPSSLGRHHQKIIHSLLCHCLISLSLLKPHRSGFLFCYFSRSPLSKASSDCGRYEVSTFYQRLMLTIILSRFFDILVFFLSHSSSSSSSSASPPPPPPLPFLSSKLSLSFFPSSVPPACQLNIAVPMFCFGPFSPLLVSSSLLLTPKSVSPAVSFPEHQMCCLRIGRCCFTGT